MLLVYKNTNELCILTLYHFTHFLEEPRNTYIFSFFVKYLGFSIQIIQSYRQFWFLTSNLHVYFFSCCMALGKNSSLMFHKVLKADILIVVESILFFTFKYYITCRFFVSGLYQEEEVLFFFLVLGRLQIVSFC